MMCKTHNFGKVIRFAFTLFLLQAKGTALAANEEQDKIELGSKVLAWIHKAEFGYFNPKQELRKDGENENMIGIFAKERIEKGELLLQVPFDLMIKSDYPNEEGQMCCGTVKAVAREMKLGSKSIVAPYANYLNEESKGQLPSAWSQAGKDLLYEIVGKSDGNDPRDTDNNIFPVEPVEWLTLDWWTYCKGDKEDEISNQAAMLVVQRSDDSIMVPGYDLYNHRNGKYHNTEITYQKGKAHTTRASKTIQKGEQIYNSYNRCTECGGRADAYGTAEILRDYGFVEDFPQHWHYEMLGGNLAFDIDVGQHGNYIIGNWEKTPRDEYLEFAKVWLARQIRRQRRIYNIRYSSSSTNSTTTAAEAGIPQHEWDISWDFYKYNLVALEMAKVVLDGVDEETGKFDKKNLKNIKKKIAPQTCSVDDDPSSCSAVVDVVGDDNDGETDHSVNYYDTHYDALGFVTDDLDYIASTCDNEGIMAFKTYGELDNLQTHYQPLGFERDESTDDTCMDIDQIVQICSSYRPHYHEIITHYAGRFVDDVKKIIFIGGGDSMLLHEALKYPSIEKVVGLELDQQVVRKSFKYFNTQPHFHDDRVEWWFGDATKSLLLLPEEYWGSFDLVLIDLSETVMSLSVTKEMDVFDALGLLLKPEGVIVKNELYMETFSKVFDYTIQILYDSPIICSQVAAMGSNRVDFLHDSTKDHEIENLLYEPLVNSDNRFDMLHDYRKNDARAQGKCGTATGYGADDSPSNQLPKEQETSAGILEIVNAENVGLALNKGIVKVIQSVLIKQGFTVVDGSMHSDSLAVVIMKEGYVVARLWPEDNYCGLDIHLWGKTYNIKEVKDALTKAIKASLVSAYKVVVGGMFGSNTWRDDQIRIGPYSKIVKNMNRNCEEKIIENIPDAKSPTDSDIIEVALKETLNLALPLGSELTVGVVCGTQENDNCLSLNVVKQSSLFSKILPFWTNTCLETGMYDCERSIISYWEESFASFGELDVLIFDSSVNYEMLQIFHSILDVDDHREKWIQSNNLAVSFSTNPEEETWRKHFLDRYRVQERDDPIARAEFLLSSDSNNDTVELGLVLCGDEEYLYSLESTERSLKDSFANEKGINIELQIINAGLFPYDFNFNPGTFKQSDYDNAPGLDQYHEQKPLGRQNIFQFEIKNSEKVTGEMFSSFLEKPLVEFLGDVKSKEFGNIGADGIVIVSANDKGNAILVWDGRSHMDINFFIFDAEASTVSDGFKKACMEQKYSIKVTPTLQDDQPRGTGRVINFPEDIDI